MMDTKHERTTPQASIDPVRAAMLVREIEAGGMYKVLPRLVPKERYGPAGDGKIGYVLAIDFETTGLVPATDKPISVGIVQVEYDKHSGELGRVVASYHGFEDPGVPIPPHITAMTGITSEFIKGKRFDDSVINRMVEESHIAVAFNAIFDCPFGQRRFESLCKIPWGCALKDVPWDEAGYFAKKLEYMIMQMGYFMDAHNALTDTHAMLTALSETRIEGVPALCHVLRETRLDRWRVFAKDAPFPKGKVLQAAGFTWSDGATRAKGGFPKGWWIDTSDKNAAIDFLRLQIYRGPGEATVQEVGRCDRFNDRWVSEYSQEFMGIAGTERARRLLAEIEAQRSAKNSSQVQHG